MIVWIAPVLSFLRSALPYALLFLRSIPDLISPKPTPASNDYTPPFTGGQCTNISYYVRIDIRPYGSNTAFFTLSTYGGFSGAIGGIEISSNGVNTVAVGIRNSSGAILSPIGTFGATEYEFKIGAITPVSGIDNCGDPLNPNPAPSIRDDGLFNPQNPKIGDDSGTINPASIVLAPALPLVLVSAILAGYSAAMAAAQAALSALEAIKKLAEGFDALKDLWDKLREFLNEWEKNRPKKRDIVRQTYGQILGDGALDFFPNNNTKFQPIQLDVVITNIPIGFGRYFGSLSPSRYRFKELGYIAFYSVNQGILETHSIQFKRTSYQIPELAIGFIYHLGLDEQIKGYSFGTFSVEKT